MTQKIVAYQNLGSIDDALMQPTSIHCKVYWAGILNVVTESELGHTCPDHARLQNS